MSTNNFKDKLKHIGQQKDEVKKKGTTAEEMMQDVEEKVDYEDVVINENTGKLSIVGAGMETHPGVASKMFEALYEASINIHMISTSEIRITVLIDEKDVDRAVRAIHEKFMQV